ncbi:glycosyltransferase family 2 protein [Shimia sagamensis]|uniref:Glycosyl transferase family 2 n=1 Tax=Shimia sagamensis TaxID=1566352 RepID=A0ABY1PBN9_9RHOB|nr:glycosyltransferase family 2 protein [Shimia sagamensis]SMP29408.1 Glycosyl transferase family 2 [Shimia sagamensis]
MRWDIVTTAFEPTAVTLGFLAHHVDLGVNKIWLHLDAPNPELENIVGEHAQIEIINCDAEYWKGSSKGERPWDFRIRQTINADAAMAQSEADWIAHIDADEYVTNTDVLFAFLQQQPEEVLTVVMQNAERVHRRGQQQPQVFAGDFRLPFPPRIHRALPLLYGKYARYLQKGLAGYWHGKAFTRVSSGLPLALHRARLPEGTPVHKGQSEFPESAILHFDGMTKEHWLDKMRKKAPDGKVLKPHNPARMRQAQDVWDNRDNEPFLDDLYRHVKEISGFQAMVLNLLGRTKRFDLDVPAKITAVFPQAKVDLAPAAVDAALKDIQEGRMPTQL